jgi:hypothetical protein
MPTGPADHADPAYPIRLDLDNGDRCRLRNGGSWSVPDANPDLVGWYYCTRVAAVWGRPKTGIDRSGRTWKVITGNETGALASHNVSVAYFVGTAP